MVIATLGILVASLIPQESITTFNLETAVARVEQDLRYARELALITNTNCGIQFVANGTYTVYEGSTATPATNPVTRQDFTQDISDEFDNVNILTNAQVEFDSMGRPVLGGGSVIQIGNGQAVTSLLVTSNTGVIVRQ